MSTNETSNLSAEEKKDFIAFMVSAGVLRFGEFITKSGRPTPYFINTGNYRTGGQIARLGEFYASLIHQVCGEGFFALLGPAYKGIPLATAAAFALWTRYQMDRPYFFNRKEAKDHGEKGIWIGYQPANGDRVIIVEDVLTAGTAVGEIMPLLRSAAAVQVTDMFISVDRQEYGATPGKTAVAQVTEEFGLRVRSLVTARDIRDWLATAGGDREILGQMDAYMDKYCVFDQV
ncbi:MAG: orotate phosphoribosyltransferase [Peptococcaceae bacterium]|jgi:orotate phosphoribosyltransferase|nr:orotate phosphoribosyltransferase [Peptococcaceae bacterium]